MRAVARPRPPPRKRGVRTTAGSPPAPLLRRARGEPRNLARRERPAVEPDLADLPGEIVSLAEADPQRRGAGQIVIGCVERGRGGRELAADVELEPRAAARRRQVSPARTEVAIVCDGAPRLEGEDPAARAGRGIGERARVTADAGEELAGVDRETGHPAPVDAPQRRAFRDFRAREAAHPGPGLAVLVAKDLRSRNAAGVELAVVDRERVALGAVAEAVAVHPPAAVVNADVAR